jgi:hypothetical protein
LSRPEANKHTKRFIVLWVASRGVLKTSKILLHNGFVGGDVAGEHKSAMGGRRIDGKENVGGVNLLEFFEHRLARRALMGYGDASLPGRRMSMRTQVLKMGCESKLIGSVVTPMENLPLAGVVGVTGAPLGPSW